MALYRVTLVDREGARREVLREAPSAELAARASAEGGRFVVRVEAAAGGGGPGRRRVPREVVAEFTDLMAMMLQSGFSLKDALEAVGEVSGGKRLGELVGVLSAGIAKGESLGAALEGLAPSFSPLYVGLVRVGERVGTVDAVFPALSRFLAERKALREKIGGAMVYPAIVVTVALAGAAALVFGLMPRARELVERAGGAEAARLQGGAGVVGAALACLLAALAIAAAAALLGRAARGRGGKAAEAGDAFLLGLPGVGGFAVALESLNFSFAMELLLGAGLPLEAALAESAGVVTNRAYRRAIGEAREAALRGESVSRALARAPFMPPYLPRWLAAGERSGQADKVFSQLRRFFQAEVERKTLRVSALAEPVLVAAAGLVVLALVFAFVLPLFSLFGNVL